jgi:ATP-dependent helicase/nuclease subunit B
VSEALGRSTAAGKAHRVWCWGDLWRAVHEVSDDGPLRLSPAAARAALGLAIDRAVDEGSTATTPSVAGWPGFRRRLRDRIAGWRRLELSPDRDPPGAGPTIDFEWAVFGHYRAVLKELDAEDAEGLATWASGVLARSTPAAFRTLRTVTVLDLEDEPPCIHRALACFESKAKEVRVTLGYDPDPALSEVYAAIAPLRQALLDRGFAETASSPNTVEFAVNSHDGSTYYPLPSCGGGLGRGVPAHRQRADPPPQPSLTRGEGAGRYVSFNGIALGPELSRPPGLREAERELFHREAHARPPIADAAGLRMLGAPQGEGVGLLVAREVRRLLSVERVAPEDLLVLVRSWDEHAEVVFDVLKSWRLPVSAVGRPRLLATEPAVSALRMAMNLPIGGWEAAEVVKLLRHGRFRPPWESARAPDALARAASSVRDSRLFRGKDAIRWALDKAIVADRADHTHRARAAESRSILDHLIATIEPLEQAGTWPEHVARLHGLADALGIGGKGDDALERLFNALDDHAAVVEAARPGRALAFTGFARAVESLINDLREPESPLAPGTVAVATVDQAAGARAKTIVLANLAEGTFPTRESVESAEDSGEPDDVSRSFSREMARFLRVLGSAGHSVILAYPTRDEKGQKLLAAGFLDDLKRRLDPEACKSVLETYDRFDPALKDHSELAIAPADARVRAVALACVDHDPGALARLATDLRHRGALAGVAGALQLARRRLEPKEFNAYNGLLADVADALAARFGPASAFSPSQLESYLLCPFQFFMKYVLKLQPVDERDELDEDHAGRGSRIHKKLEELELTRKRDGGDRLDVVEMVIRTEMSVELTVTSEADPGLHAIENRRLDQTLRRYVEQAGDYDAGKARGKAKGREKTEAPAPVPHLFEVVFGDNDKNPDHGLFQIGEGPSAVRLQGTIDRVDVVETAEGARFRVIDYKTGKPPSAKDVTSFLMVQLPLYALAVERLGLAGEVVALSDVGYWGLKDKGYVPITLEDWAATKARLETEVIDAVRRLREGEFLVDPKKETCTRYCDYSSVCRIGQLRSVGKVRKHEAR